MPYIKQVQRDSFDVEIENLINAMRAAGAKKGDVNYAICRVVLGVLEPSWGWNYQALSEAVGVFRDAESEIRRRLLDPYEDQAIAKNGDVPEIEKQPFRTVMHDPRYHTVLAMFPKPPEPRGPADAAD